jgi:peptidoglycan hydrolase CwlO-like protein
MQKWSSVKIVLVVLALCLAQTSLFAADMSSTNGIYLDRSKLIAQQTDLLKNRLTQAQNQFALLQKNVTQAPAQINKSTQSQAGFDIAVARSNIDSINIEISESQQTIGRLEKDIQELENQLNVFSVFGVKVAPSGALDINGLRAGKNSRPIFN